MFGYYWIGIFREALEGGNEFTFSTIAHGDDGIAAQASEFGSADRRSTEDCGKFFLLHFGEPVESRIYQAFTRLKFESGGYRRFAVPGTHVLADVATENMPAHLRAQGFGDVTALLDGQIRNAQTRIEFAGCDKRVRGAGVDTARTASATVGGGQIGFQFQRTQDHSQEKPRAEFLINDASVLRDPSDARIFCVDAFDQWSRVDVGAERMLCAK